MRSEAAIQALNDYNRDRSEDKKNAVRAAVARLVETSGNGITQAQVARDANVSREFINSHPELKSLIKSAARAHGSGETLGTESPRADAPALLAQNRTYAATIERQKQTIAELRTTIDQLRHQRQLHLGAQLAATAIDRDVHCRLQLDHDRLAADNQQQHARIDELQRLTDRLQEDLAVSRQAHADDVNRLVGNEASIVPLSRHRPSLQIAGHDQEV